MQADIRYYILIVTEKDMGDETIYVHTDRMMKKAKEKYPQTKFMIDNIVIPNDYVDCHYGFSHNRQLTCKRTIVEQRLASLTANSQLIIHGHGDVSKNKINGVSAAVLAVGLTSMKFRANCHINITGCDLGRNADVSGASRANASASDMGTRSFAYTFQSELFRNAGLRCAVHARTSWVVVLADGRKKTVKFDAKPSPAYVLEDEMASEQPKSKIRFDIDLQGVQTMNFPY